MSIPLSAGATLHPLVVPARADAAGAGEFRELALVRNLVYRVKSAALRTWFGTAGSSPRVITYNAEENRHMLAINEALGFTAVAYEGAWKKELS